jgi:Domain of unknown function (DUF4276)
VRRCRNLNSDV